MKEVKRYDSFGYDGLSAMMVEDQFGDYVRLEDYDALLVERDELLGALKGMCSEFRGHDLPYGSSAYLVANTLINKSRSKAK